MLWSMLVDFGIYGMIFQLIGYAFYIVGEFNSFKTSVIAVHSDI